MQAVNHAWQPVTPTSPPWDGVPVLVWHAQGGIWISGRRKSRYKGMGFDWYLGGRSNHPTHWMPLPKPPVDNPVDKSA